MFKFIIKGGVGLEGEVILTGNKNPALKLIPAALLANTPSTLTKIPVIRDVDVLLQIVEKWGDHEDQGINKGVMEIYS